jgi:hypothetical protein
VRPRSVALTLGVVYAAYTVLELTVGDWTVGDATIIQRTTKTNLLHWAASLGLLGAFFSGARAARLACRIVGPLFLALTAWGLLSASSAGSLFGYPDGIPVIHNALHGLTAIAAVSAGFPIRRKGA